MRRARRTRASEAAAPRPPRRAPAPRRRRRRRGLTVQGLPIVKPPYGVLVGDRPRSRRAHVAGAARRHAGQRPQSSGAQGHEHPEDRPGRHVRRRADGHQDARRHRRSAGDDDAGRPRGAMLRAYDKKTGQQVGEVWMPAPQSGSPMTYRSTASSTSSSPSAAATTRASTSRSASFVRRSDDDAVGDEHLPDVARPRRARPKRVFERRTN